MLNLYEKNLIYNYDEYDIDIQKRYKNIINIFKSLSKENIPNILLYGEEGSGKKTLIYSFFNNIKKKKYIEKYKINNKEIEYIIFKNNEYIELDLKELGIYKKFILKDIIKKITETKKVDNNKNKIIIIHNIYLLNIDDQFILRKIIEENIINCRFILISNTINNLIEAIKSRCLILKTPGFNKKIISNKLNNIIKKENLEIKKKILNDIINNSNNNLKKSILELNTFVNIKKIIINDNEKEYSKIINENKGNMILNLFKNFKNKQINYDKVDEILYKLIINYKIKPIVIIEDLYKLLINKLKLTEQQKYEIIDINYKYNIYLINSSKHIIYLQSYIYNLHTIIK